MLLLLRPVSPARSPVKSYINKTNEHFNKRPTIIYEKAKLQQQQQQQQHYRYMWVIIKSEPLKLIYFYSIDDITMQSTSVFVCRAVSHESDAQCMYLCLQFCLQSYTCLLQLVVLVCQHLHISIHFCSFCFSFFKFFQCLQLSNNSTY